MLAGLGANIVGMSTVQEAIAAHHMGVKVLCLSFVTNMAGGLGDSLNHHDVIQLVNDHQDRLLQTLKRVIQLS
jgi:purine-nucleoside phosphorylase